MDKLIAWLNEVRGRRVELATALGIGPSALSQWANVPADRCLEVERVTGISRHDLRPDVFGPAADTAARNAIEQTGEAA